MAILKKKLSLQDLSLLITVRMGKHMAFQTGDSALHCTALENDCLCLPNPIIPTAVNSGSFQF